MCEARDLIPRTKRETGSKHKVLFLTQECFLGYCPGKGVQSPLLGVLKKLGPPGKETPLRWPYNSGDGGDKASGDRQVGGELVSALMASLELFCSDRMLSEQKWHGGDHGLRLPSLSTDDQPHTPALCVGLSDQCNQSHKGFPL